MKIRYNVTGAQRKSLASAVSEELNAPVHYLGAPTFAYEVGGYHIDKIGTLTGKDNSGLEDALHRKGFDAAEREYNEPDTCGGGPDGMNTGDAPAPGKLVIEVPMDGFTPEKLDNLVKLVGAKAPLLKAALGAEDLPIRQTDEDGGKLCFPWFGLDLDADTVDAYAALIEKLCEAAKEKKRVTAKERDVDNPKYAMRCWLLSLGFIGDEYKRARKILLKNLKGNSSYKSKIRQRAEV
jgi:hypothetical protein